jgi:RNA polymerase sigma-70 factor (ECF subfamily)
VHDAKALQSLSHRADCRHGGIGADTDATHRADGGAMTPRRLSIVRGDSADSSHTASSTASHALDADATYIVGVRAGDEAVFRAMVAAYLAPLTRFAFGCIGEEDPAHDIVQDVFVRVWRLGPDWDPRAGVAAYLFTAVRNRALDMLKAGRASTRARETLRAELDFDAHTADPYVDVLLVSAVRQELTTLTSRQRDALRLRYEHGHTMPQVAQILGIHQTAAEKLVARALASLRARLASFRSR